MSIQITALTLHFLSENYLHDLKKQSLARSKPSKALLDALKHSTSVNKQNQTKIQTLTSQLTSLTNQNEFLKEMVYNLNGQMEFLKNLKQEKNKKFCQLQTQYRTKIEFLINQNHLLKKQIQMLKTKLMNVTQNNQGISGEGFLTQNIQGSKIEQPYDLQIIKKQSLPISQILKNTSQHQQQSLCDFIPIQQSVKFLNYLNHQQAAEKNQQTRPNSKLKLQFYEDHEVNTPKINKIETQSEQSGRVFTLKQQSKVSKDFNEFIEQQISPSQRNHITSIQSITPKIIEITSMQEICIDDEDYKRIETPTLPKCLFNPCSQKRLSNDSKFKVFEEDLTTSIQGSRNKCNRNTDITFLNLQTKKSIEQGIDKTSSSKIIGQNLSNKKQIQKKQSININNLQVNHENENILDNISGVDLHGLINDIQTYPYQNQKGQIESELKIQIHSQQNDSSDPEEMFYKTQGFTNRKITQKSVYLSKSKRSVSDYYQNDKIKTIIDYLKQPSQSSKMASIENKLPSISSHSFQQQNQTRIPQKPAQNKKMQNIKVPTQSPYKYMSIADSFKTIEFNKSFKQLKQNQIKSRKNIDKINEIDKSNESSCLSKSRAHQNNSKSSGTKSMVNSKILFYNNVRRNKKNKSLSPLSVENRKNQCIVQDQVCKTNASEKNGKTYSLIQSVRNKKHDDSESKNVSLMVPDSLNNEDKQVMQNATVILNCSTFRKKFEDLPMTKSTHPSVVTFFDRKYTDEKSD